MHPKIVVIGGGTGSFTLLRSLKRRTPNVTALVAMFDSGGSSGQLRDEYGVLPPGDVRQCLVALANEPKIRDVFNYRFGEGGLEGHSFGNLFLSAVEKVTDDFDEAIRLASHILRITGRVVPITLEKAQLVLKDGNTETVGEHNIDAVRLDSFQKPDISLRPQVAINPVAREAIAEADLVVIAPGSLYESLVSSLVVTGVAEALQSTKATVVQVANLVTKPGQTDGWSVSDFVSEIERFAGEGVIDCVLYNTKKPTKTMLEQYSHAGEYPVVYDTTVLAAKPYVAIGLDLIHVHSEAGDPNDKLALERSLIRHDAGAVSDELMEIYRATLLTKR